jgi:hypothetical protein
VPHSEVPYRSPRRPPVRSSLPILLALLAALPGLGANAARAQDDLWLLDGNPLCVAAEGQTQPRICPDGAGGAFVAWEDQRAGARIFVTHVDGFGAIASGWPTNGAGISSVPSSDEFDQVLMPDGAGGVFVAWSDGRDPAGSRAYVKRLNGDGTVADGWPADGLLVSGYFQVPRTLLPDGAGGVLVIVSEYFFVPDVIDLFAHHVLPGGTKDPSWPAAGRSLLGAQPQVHSALPTADGSGGFIVAWSSGSYPAIVARALHFGGDGIADPAWPASGLRLCAGGLTDVALDGTGGGYVVVGRAGATDSDLFAQRFTSTGSLATGWGPEGVALCTAAGETGACFVVSDGASGMIAAWEDFRGGFEDQNIYARRISGDGTSPPGWDSQGNPLSSAPFSQELKGLISDSQGGAIACWYDHRDQKTTLGDVYAQRIGPGGTPPPGWPPDGQGICTNAADQDLPIVATNGAGGAIVAWRDYRNDELGDIYAGRVRQDAVTPVLAAVARAVVEPDHVQVVWRLAGARGTYVLVERSAGSGAWERRGTIPVDESDEATFDDREVTAGARYGYRIVAEDAGPIGEIWLQTPNATGFALRGPTPNPAQGALVASFSLPNAGQCRLELFDSSGRGVLARDLGRLERGEHRVPLGASRDLAPGIYRLVLSSGDRRATVPISILK